MGQMKQLSIKTELTNKEGFISIITSAIEQRIDEIEIPLSYLIQMKNIREFGKQLETLFDKISENNNFNLEAISFGESMISQTYIIRFHYKKD